MKPCPSDSPPPPPVRGLPAVQGLCTCCCRPECPSPFCLVHASSLESHPSLTCQMESRSPRWASSLLGVISAGITVVLCVCRLTLPKP